MIQEGPASFIAQYYLGQQNVLCKPGRPRIRGQWSTDFAFWELQAHWLLKIHSMVGQELYQLLALGQEHVALKLEREGCRFVGVWGYGCDSKHVGSWIPFHCLGYTGPKWRLPLLFGDTGSDGQLV